MQTVKINKARLAEIVTANRAAHQERFQKALAGWRRETLAILEARVSDLKVGNTPPWTFPSSPPTDHTGEYDRTLKMLELSVDQEVTLDAQNFQAFVMDEWNWKPQWMSSTQYYMQQAGIVDRP